MRTLRKNLRDVHSTPNEMFHDINMHARLDWLTPLYTELRLVSVVSENAARRQRKYSKYPRSIQVIFSAGSSRQLLVSVPHTVEKFSPQQKPIEIPHTIKMHATIAPAHDLRLSIQKIHVVREPSNKASRVPPTTCCEKLMIRRRTALNKTLSTFYSALA